MSNKQRKVKQQARRKRMQKARQRKGPAARGGGLADAAVVELVEYELTREPQTSPYEKHFSPQEREDFDRVSEQMGTDPVHCTETLERLIAAQPEFPIAYNFLAVAYQAAGRHDDAIALMEETYRRFPRYLFARTNMALIRMQQGRSDEVPRFFDGQYALHRLYPERRGHFHVSEFANFYAVMGLYHYEMGKVEVAETCLAMVEKLEYDCVPLNLLRKRLRVGSVRRYLQSLLTARRAAR